MHLSLLFLLFAGAAVNSEETTTHGWSPGLINNLFTFIYIFVCTYSQLFVYISTDPCFPTCTTGPDQTSPPPDRGCIKTDCFDEPLCQE